MGMSKAIHERIFVSANVLNPKTRFNCVRYGNVLASRGSVIPLFHEQIKSGGPVTVTAADMTRFLLSIDQAVDTIFAVISEGNTGEIYVPIVESATVAATVAATVVLGVAGAAGGAVSAGGFSVSIFASSICHSADLASTSSISAS